MKKLWNNSRKYLMYIGIFLLILLAIGLGFKFWDKLFGSNSNNGPHKRVKKVVDNLKDKITDIKIENKKIDIEKDSKISKAIKEKEKIDDSLSEIEKIENKKQRLKSLVSLHNTIKRNKTF